jgi:small subunit ribosomal protein S18e
LVPRSVEAASCILPSNPRRPSRSAGELTSEEIDKIVAVIQNPLQFMPSWFVNRKKDIKDGKTSHVYANLLDTKMRESLERLWKCR